MRTSSTTRDEPKAAATPNRTQADKSAIATTCHSIDLLELAICNAHAALHALRHYRYLMSRTQTPAPDLHDAAIDARDRYMQTLVDLAQAIDATPNSG